MSCCATTTVSRASTAPPRPRSPRPRPASSWNRTGRRSASRSSSRRPRPGEPVRPNRKRIASTGVFGGVAAGVGLVMLMEMLDKSIRDTSDLERRLRIRPIVAIPYVTIADETRRRKRLWCRRLHCWRDRRCLALMLVLIQLFYMPLDLVRRKGPAPPWHVMTSDVPTLQASDWAAPWPSVVD